MSYLSFHLQTATDIPLLLAIHHSIRLSEQIQMSFFRTQSDRWLWSCLPFGI